MKTRSLIALFALFACGGAASGPRYASLGPRGEPLKGAFNQAEGKVRAVLLVSPT